MQQQMIQCPRCGRTNSIHQQFCGTCGERIQYISPIGPVGPAGPIITVTPATPSDPSTDAPGASTAPAKPSGPASTDIPGAPAVPATPDSPASTDTPSAAAPAKPGRDITVDASQAQTAVTKYLESTYANHLKEVHFTKCWYSHAGNQSFWDVEGLMLTKKKISGSNELHFRFQVDPNSGEVLGYEL